MMRPCARQGAFPSMEPCGVELRYRDRAGEAGYLGVGAFSSCANDDLRLEAVSDGEVIELACVPARPLSLELVRLRLRHAFASGERVLLGGYQSWTDTVERPAWSRMRGLRGVPATVVRRYSLDALGDYGFVDYPARRGCQHGFSYASFRRGEAAVLVGSLDERRGFTLVRTWAARGEVELSPECPAREIAAGERIVLGRFAIVRGGLQACYDRWLYLAGVSPRPAPPLVGYTSWYRHYGDIDESKLARDLEGARSFFADEAGVSDLLDASGAARLFQIDDGYCKVGDWTRPDAVKFPSGLALLSERIRDAGFLPGLWLAPFVCERDSRIFRERPEWLLRDEAGEPVPTGSHWSGGFALDTRNVEVRSYILEVLQTVVREWGFRLVKADFLYAACLRPHDGLNRGQLMADALDLLRRGVGEDVFVLACGVPLASAFGRVDYCRIGCDVGLDWDDAPHMRLLHRERVSTKRSLANTRGRAPLDGLAFANDPDVFFLRDDLRLTRAQREELLEVDSRLASVLLTSDDMAKWDDSARALYRRALATMLG